MSGAEDEATSLRIDVMPQTGKAWVVWAIAAAGAALAAAILWLVWPEEWKAPGSPDEGSEGGASAKSVRIESVELRRDHGNAVLNLRATIENRAVDEPLVCVAPDVRLLAGAAGEEVPPFFLATRGERAPVIPAGERSTVELLYWLEDRHVQDVLALEVRGERAEVKSAKAFDLPGLENGKTQRVPVGDW